MAGRRTAICQDDQHRVFADESFVLFICPLEQKKRLNDQIFKEKNRKI